MSADYPLAQEHFVPRNFMFNSNACKVLVIHKTAGDATPQAVYNTFLASGNPGRSVHYAVGQDGTIWQYVPESLGAGGNCCVESGYDPFWGPYVNQYGNLNLCTISVEHCDPSTDNGTPLTPAQKEVSFQLVAYLAKKYNISASHIKTHASIDPQSRARCPGNYPMDELIQYVEQGGDMLTYTPQSADFGQFFTASDPDHWKSKSGLVVQFGIKNFYARLSLDGNSLPIIGLPRTNEMYLTIDGKQIVLQVFERGAIWYDANRVKGTQPGSDGVCQLAFLTDPDLLAHIPGLTLPAAPVDTSIVEADINAIADAIAAPVAKALADLKKL